MYKTALQKMGSGLDSKRSYLLVQKQELFRENK